MFFFVTAPPSSAAGNGFRDNRAVAAKATALKKFNAVLGKYGWSAGFVVFLAACLALFFSSPPRFGNMPRMTFTPGNIYEKTLVVAMDYDYQPYSFFDGNGKPAGFDVELIYALADKMGVNADVRLMPWNDARNAVLSGRADLLTGLERVPENMPAFELSVPLHNDPFIAFGTAPLDGMSGLHGKRIAVLRGSASYDTILKPCGFARGITLYDSYHDVFASVIRGENDYAVSRYSVGRRELVQLVAEHIQAAVVLPNNYLCIGVRGGNRALLERVDAALVELAVNGTKEALVEKWLERYVDVISWADFLKAYKVSIMGASCGLALLIGFFIAYSRSRNARLRQKDMERILEYQRLITEATKGLYENIYELDITRNRAASEETRHYFERLGIPGDTPVDEALRHIAATQIRTEDRQGYLDAFSPEKVLEAYQKGVRSLSYDFMISGDGKSYYWLRIMASIFVLPQDRSVRLIVYRQNIDAEKRHWKMYQYQRMVMEAAKGLYEDIYEMDMTHNCAGNEETRAYFETLGLPGDAAYDRFLRCVAEKQIKDEYRQRYLDAFLPDRVLQAYARGTDSLVCEVMLSTDGVRYYWLRITARVFFWAEDNSVRIFSFRQNIDAEKSRESLLSAQARLDPLTGLYNKTVTENLIGEALTSGAAGDCRYAFFILDVDNFKLVNDDFGHAVGDMVLREFSAELKRQFREKDIVGRIGGDEFAAFLLAPDRDWVEKKARALSSALRKSFRSDAGDFSISASIGIALAPEDGTDFAALYKNADAVLYQTKKRGKNGFTVHAGA